MACAKPEEVLQGEIRKRRVPSPGGFLPDPDLKALMTKETVEAILSQHKSELNDPESINELTSFVVKDASRVFAVLVGMERPSLIEAFCDNDFRQDMLPVSYRYPENDAQTVQVEPINGGDCQGKVAKTFSQPPWRINEIEDFYHRQWSFMSPVFRKDTFGYVFGANVVLPFTWRDEPPKAKAGGYGVVHKMSIHKGHIELPPNHGLGLDEAGNYHVARKEVGGAEENAKREARALQQVQDLVKSNHAIKAITYYQQGEPPRHYFIFPWAERGNLWEFWVDRQTSPTTDRDFLIWVFKQLAGLAEALAEMHREEFKGVHIRHGDLKPENILCFRDDSQSSTTPVRLVMTDVGLARVHDKETKVRSITSTKVSTVRYQPPELDPVLSKGKVPRRFDVWAIGCIYMEFAIWLLYGAEELDRFTKETSEFWQRAGENGAVVHARVQVWLSHMLNEDGRCSLGTALGRLVKLIDEKLLVVRVRSIHGDEETNAAQQGAPPPLPTSTKSPRNFMQRCLSSKKGDGNTGSFVTKMVDLMKPGKTRSSAAEARDMLREIAVGLENRTMEPVGGGDLAQMRGPPSPSG